MNHKSILKRGERERERLRDVRLMVVAMDYGMGNCWQMQIDGGNDDSGNDSRIANKECKMAGKGQ